MIPQHLPDSFFLSGFGTPGLGEGMTCAATNDTAQPSPILAPIAFTVEDRMMLRLVYVQQKALQVQMETILSILSKSSIYCTATNSESATSSPAPTTTGAESVIPPSVMCRAGGGGGGAKPAAGPSPAAGWQLASPTSLSQDLAPLDRDRECVCTQGTVESRQPESQHTSCRETVCLTSSTEMRSASSPSRKDETKPTNKVSHSCEELGEEGTQTPKAAGASLRENPQKGSSSAASSCHSTPRHRRTASLPGSAFDTNPLLPASLHHTPVRSASMPSQTPSHYSSCSSSLIREGEERIRMSLLSPGERCLATRLPQRVGSDTVTRPSLISSCEDRPSQPPFPDPSRKVRLEQPKGLKDVGANAIPIGSTKKEFVHTDATRERSRSGASRNRHNGAVKRPYLHHYAEYRDIHDDSGNVSGMDYYSDGSYDTVEYLKRNELL